MNGSIMMTKCFKFIILRFTSTELGEGLFNATPAGFPKYIKMNMVLLNGVTCDTAHKSSYMYLTWVGIIYRNTLVVSVVQVGSHGV